MIMILSEYGMETNEVYKEKQLATKMRDKCCLSHITIEIKCQWCKVYGSNEICWNCGYKNKGAVC
jgi:hypothetical protein